MAWMSIEQMREEILRVYHEDGWRYKVLEMSDNQVAAIYKRMLSNGQLKKDPEKKHDLTPTVIPAKEPENRFGSMVGEQLKFDI